MSDAIFDVRAGQYVDVFSTDDAAEILVRFIKVINTCLTALDIKATVYWMWGAESSRMPIREPIIVIRPLDERDTRYIADEGIADGLNTILEAACRKYLPDFHCGLEIYGRMLGEEHRA